MTCASALEYMLDADPAELTLLAETPLVAHLRACARCARAANVIVGETAQIALGMPRAIAGRVGRTRRVRNVAFVAIAATVVLAIGVSRSGGGDVVPSRTPSVVAVGVGPVAVAPQPSVAGLVRVEAVAERATAAVLVPGPDRTVQNVGPTDGISVAPPAGTRATIFATRDPNITVVWLQADDTNRSPR